MTTTFLMCVAVLLGDTASTEKTPNSYEKFGPLTADCLAENQPIDQIVFARLAAAKIQPVLCSDAVFVRRVYLDVIGMLPTAEEARQFIQDPDTQNKRQRLIDRLLTRDEFAQYWSMKWGDLLRIKAEFPINLWPNAAQAYHRWVLESIAENKPYNKFARELLTSSGSNFRVGPVNFYRAISNRTPEGIASAVALTFMGVRTDAWPQERLAGMAAFFSQVGYKPTREWKEENVFWDPLKVSPSIPEAVPEPMRTTPAPAPVVAPLRHNPKFTAIFPDGTTVQLLSDRDPREVFADWLISPQNPWFTRNIVNRVWAWLMGRGIIHEPDDIRDDNPPSHPALLAYLEKEMIAGQYNMKHLYRLILNSKTYQLSSISHSKSPGAWDQAQAEVLFANYPLRRLEAEVLIDAINQITGTSDLYTSAIPEPFTYIPADMPAVAIADGSITSPFLTLFGRSARATGMENERPSKPVPAQWLHMLNSSHIQRKLESGPKLIALFDKSDDLGAKIEELYLMILSRFPTADEMKNVREYGGQPAATQKKGKGKGRHDWVDITWALINNPEFLYRH